MREIEVSAKTYELALTKGLEQLNTVAENVDIEILSQSTGLFKKVTLKIKIKETSEIKKTGTGGEILTLKTFLDNLFKKMNLLLTVDVVEEENRFVFNIKGENANVIIGYRGEVLDSIQYLLNLINVRKLQQKRIDLDVEGYRAKRMQSLETLARSLARKASKNRRKIKLEPMNPYERRIIHAALQEDRYVTTTSEGEEPNRCIVIIPNIINQARHDAKFKNAERKEDKDKKEIIDNKDYRDNKENKNLNQESRDLNKKANSYGQRREPFKNNSFGKNNFNKNKTNNSYDKYKQKEAPKKIEDKFYDNKHYEEDDIEEDYSTLPSRYNKKDGAH